MERTQKILVIMNDAAARGAVIAGAQRTGFVAEILERSDGPGGESALRSGGFDCAIIDCGIDGRDAFSIVRQSRDASVRTPVIIVNSASDEDLARRAMESGAADYIPKSRLDSDHVVQAIRYAIRLSESEQRAAETIEQKTEPLRAIFDHIPVMIDCFDADGKLLMVNREWERVLGWSFEEARHIDILSEFYPDPDYRRYVLDFIRSGSTDWADFRMRRRDGREIDTTWADIHLSDGRTIGIGQDVTERHKSEQSLREAEERYRTLFEQSTYGIVLVDPTDGSIVEFNSAAHRMLGFSREEYARLKVTDIDIGLPVQEIRLHIQRALDTGAEEFETRHRARNGELREVLISIRALNIRGRVLLHSIHRDVTEANRLREQLLHAQKMEAIGRLAGGVAHDFNNLLAVISGYSEALSRRLGSESPLHAHVAEIEKAAERGGALTRQLLAFSRHQVIKPEDLDLRRILASTQEMLRRVIGGKIEIVYRPAPVPCRVRADAGQIEQVIVNLALNARDAMPGGGTMSFELSIQQMPRKVATLLSLQPGDYVKLSVADTGVGMDAKTRARIFEPFFTTKEHGTGLGLSIVYGIIQQYGGSVAVESTPGKGSRFDVYLPCLPAASTPAPTGSDM